MRYDCMRLRIPELKLQSRAAKQKKRLYLTPYNSTQ